MPAWDYAGCYKLVSNKNKKKSARLTSDKAVVKYDPLQRYLSEISRYNLLTREEEVSLGKRVQEQGDQEAAYRLVTSNLRLVVKIAMDLLEEGLIDEKTALNRIDPIKLDETTIPPSPIDVLCTNALLFIYLNFIVPRSTTIKG